MPVFAVGAIGAAELVGMEFDAGGSRVQGSRQSRRGKTTIRGSRRGRTTIRGSRRGKTTIRGRR
eukprot:4470512-Pleurochrysis_carterae.AAC.1